MFYDVIEEYRLKLFRMHLHTKMVDLFLEDFLLLILVFNSVRLIVVNTLQSNSRLRLSMYAVVLHLWVCRWESALSYHRWRRRTWGSYLTPISLWFSISEPHAGAHTFTSGASFDGHELAALPFLFSPAIPARSLVKTHHLNSFPYPLCWS